MKMTKRNHLVNEGHESAQCAVPGVDEDLGQTDQLEKKIEQQVLNEAAHRVSSKHRGE